jgi:hypothetical protein
LAIVSCGDISDLSDLRLRRCEPGKDFTIDPNNGRALSLPKLTRFEFQVKIGITYPNCPEIFYDIDTLNEANALIKRRTDVPMGIVKFYVASPR